MKKILAFIPARGGSKGVPGKNTRMAGGKPLIAWTIEQALQSQGVDRVIVSTDSNDIADVSRAYGAETPFMRPPELASDTSTTESAMLHALDWLRENQAYQPDAILLLQCTSPVRAADAIEQAIAQFIDQRADSLLSVTPFWHFLWRSQHHPQALYDYQNRPRRQDIPHSDIQYKENGSIYLSETAGFLKSANRLFGKIELFIMSDEESLEIDTELDLQLVDAILSYRDDA